MSWRLTLAAFLGGMLCAVAGWLAWPVPPAAMPPAAMRPVPPARSAAELMDVIMWGKEPIGGPFSLVDHAGRRRSDGDFRGKLLLVYFGFTACQDACPTDLQAIAGALDRLGPAGDAVQPLFITVNPELDTPAQLASYVALFHPRLIGLTGERRQIEDVAAAYKVWVARTTPGSRASDPGIDHGNVVYLVGAEGSYIGFFPPGTPADRMVDVLRPRVAALAKP